MPTVNLISADDVLFIADVEALRLSTTIMSLLEVTGFEETIPLPTIPGDILELVLQFCEKHKDDPEDESHENNDISQWDQEFLNMDGSTLSELISTARFLDIDKLLHVTCKHVANMIIGKSPEEIREILNIQNDFTVDEEEETQQENHLIKDE